MGGLAKLLRSPDLVSDRPALGGGARMPGESMIRIVTAAVAWAFLATAAQAEDLHRGPYLQDGGHGCRNETAIPVDQYSIEAN